ncbi:MAG: phage holin family protein [Candidatus Altimarinota bacterium]|jgi:hypothetical protein|nr:phage holin family protein [Candidatus Gracilibacteria bacterium]
MKAIGYFLLVALLIWLAATHFGQSLGIELTGQNTYISALIFAVILSLVNLVIGSILRIITFPFNILTLGLVSFLISLLMIYITDSFYDNIKITSLLAYLVVAIIPAFAGMMVGKK